MISFNGPSTPQSNDTPLNDFRPSQSLLIPARLWKEPGARSPEPIYSPLWLGSACHGGVRCRLRGFSGFIVSSESSVRPPPKCLRWELKEIKLGRQGGKIHPNI